MSFESERSEGKQRKKMGGVERREEK